MDHSATPGLPRRPADEAVRQEQFLTVLGRDEALARFTAALAPKPLGTERTGLAHALGRVLAEDMTSPSDVPPFDRSGVDGFAVRSLDCDGRSAAARRRCRRHGRTYAT